MKMRISFWLMLITAALLAACGGGTQEPAAGPSAGETPAVAPAALSCNVASTPEESPSR